MATRRLRYNTGGNKARDVSGAEGYELADNEKASARIASNTHRSLKTNLDGLSKTDSRLLRRKQQKLRAEIRDTDASIQDLSEHFHNGLAATLIFAQESAGTAICISSTGLILTCAHCIAESEEEYRKFKSTWLLFYTGQAVQAECFAWDPFRDLALLQIVAENSDESRQAGISGPFASVPVARQPPKNNISIYCIGQPGRDDLESNTARKTTYNLVEISHGRLRGNVPDSDPQDNSDIGILKHDAWTYWGHSGAPLLSSTSGELVGLHSSWDDQTAMRHGVPLVAIREFLHLFEKSCSAKARPEILAMLGQSQNSILGSSAGSSRSNAILLDDL